VSAASYFVYYRVSAARRDEMGRLAEALFAALERETGVRGRLMRRRDDPGTYMEVYENVPEAARFETLLEQQVSRLGIARCLVADAARRTEIFVNAPPGAA